MTFRKWLDHKQQYFGRRVAKIELHEKIGSGRGRRLFAHVLANIDMFGLLEAFKKVTFVDFSLVLIGFERRRKIGFREQFGTAGNGTSFAKTRFSKDVTKPE